MGDGRASWLRIALGIGLAGHLVWCIARIPHAAWLKREKEIGQWRQQGPIRYHLGRQGDATVAAVEWLADHTPKDAVILWEGSFKGPMEFAPALLWPRLFVAAGYVTADATTLFDRPLARGAPDGGEAGQIVLVATERDLRLATR